MIQTWGIRKGPPPVALSSPTTAFVVDLGDIGPGDIVSGATAWYGLRAYNRAYATGSNPAIDVVDTLTGLIQTTVNITAGGDLDTATILGLGYAVSVKKIYDQTGNGNHLTQATNANRPALTLSGIGSLPVLTFDGSAYYLALTGSAFNGGVDVPQPWTVSSVFNNTGSASDGTVFAADNVSAAVGVFVDDISGAGHVEVYSGSGLAVAAARSTWWAFQGVGNGASSDANLNGVANIGSTGTVKSIHKENVAIGRTVLTGTAEAFAGTITEVGIWPVAFTGTDSSAMSANQHAYWGF